MHEFVANLLPSLLVKKIENRIIVSEVMAKSLVSCFVTHGVEWLLVLVHQYSEIHDLVSCLPSLSESRLFVCI